MRVWLPWRVHLLVKSYARITLQIDQTKPQQRRGLMRGNIIESTTMSLTFCCHSMDCLQDNWWPSIGMVHCNVSMLRLLSVSMSQYHRNNEKNHCRRLYRKCTTIVTSLTMLSNTRTKILTSEIRVHRPWGYRRSIHVPIFQRLLPHLATWSPSPETDYQFYWWFQ